MCRRLRKDLYESEIETLRSVEEIMPGRVLASFPTWWIFGIKAVFGHREAKIFFHPFEIFIEELEMLVLEILDLPRFLIN